MISTTLLTSILFPIVLTGATLDTDPTDPTDPDNGDVPECPSKDCRSNSVPDSWFDGLNGWRPLSCSVRTGNAPVFDIVNLTISFAQPWFTAEAKLWLGFTKDGDTTWIFVAEPATENELYSASLSLPLPMEAPFQAQLLSVDSFGRRTVSVCETR